MTFMRPMRQEYAISKNRIDLAARATNDNERLIESSMP
jgi:hypothetical protein